MVCKRKKILIVDDEQILRNSMSRVLRDYDVSSTCCGEQALELAQKNKYDLALIDIVMPGIGGIQTIEELKKIDKHIKIISMTAYGTVEGAVEAMKKGASHYLTKPFDIQETLSLVKETLQSDIIERENSKKILDLSKSSKQIVWQSEDMGEVFELVKKIADTNSSVLITGESGTGKELIAHYIHNESLRAKNKMIAVNCSAIPEELLESELFGHVKGSFTGAINNRIGRFELANKGTIFLDEIGDMTLSLQAKILRVLQEKSFEPIGSSETKHVDVRVITATNRNLEKAVSEGTFREDLFYRINVIPVKLPPLRKRKEDISLLIDYFIEKFNHKQKRNITGINTAARNLLINYPWPGNVRELENLIERMVIIKGSGEIMPSDLPERYQDTFLKPQTVPLNKIIIGDDGIDFKTLISNFEDELIVQALRRTNWNKKHAATLLGLNRTTLVEKLKKKNYSLEM